MRLVMSITVMEVFGRLGLKPAPSESMAVGQAMQALYRQRYGRQPPKENRPKTNGGGTHCMAVYPAHWRARIEQVIRGRAVEAQKQVQMF